MGRWRSAALLLVGACSLVFLFFIEITVQGPEVDDELLGEETHDSNEGGIESLEERNHCVIPSEGYKAWKTGIVTSLGSPIVKNCSKIIAGDKIESYKAEKIFRIWFKIYNRKVYSRRAYKSLLEESRDCSKLRRTLSNNLYNTKLERDYPIAYIFLVYESPLQFLRLFKVLYKPQNSYCIHVDTKSPFKEFYDNIIECFDNVIAPSKSFDVRWGKYTMLEAQMQCFTDLVDLREKQSDKKKWNYAINLCGKELPLHTTKEMVQMIQSMKETSSVVAWHMTDWWTMHRLRGNKIPYNLDFYKSMAYNALSADFVKFIVRHEKAQKVYEVIKKVEVPEEHFYAVLFHMPGAPGGYNPEIPDESYFEVGHYFWRTTKAEQALPCFGGIVHGICIVNHSDLPRIMRETKNGATALFQNKYFMERNHVVMDCMEEMIVAKNMLEYEKDCQV